MRGSAGRRTDEHSISLLTQRWSTHPAEGNPREGCDGPPLVVAACPAPADPDGGPHSGGRPGRRLCEPDAEQRPHLVISPCAL